MRRGSNVGGLVIAVMLSVAAAALGLPIWVSLTLVIPFALWWVWPKRPQLCHMCERDIHPHDYYDGRCMAGYCQCDATVDSRAGDVP